MLLITEINATNSFQLKEGCTTTTITCQSKDIKQRKKTSDDYEGFG